MTANLTDIDYAALAEFRFALRRFQVVFFMSISLPQRVTAQACRGGMQACDVFDHVRRVETMVDGLREVLASVFAFGNLMEQQRTGVITRQLAAWAAILAVPTAIAGIYGMNFEFMPELRMQYGYFLVLGVIGAICTLLYARFRRVRWL